MPDLNLSQAEADTLMGMEKNKTDDNQWQFPEPGAKVAIPLISSDKREDFLLDVYRGRINLSKVTHQNRARKAVVLMRLDVEGAAHENPDGENTLSAPPHLPRGLCRKMGRPGTARPIQKYGQFAGNPGRIHEALQHRRTADNTDGVVLMVAEIQELLDRYAAWLKDNTSLRQLGNEWVEITTPYLDPNNDHLQIYARQDNGSFVLTDDSKTLHELEMAGCDLNTPKRKDLLQVTLRGFGVNLKGHALEVYASPENFAARKHRLIQAMLAVSDMFYPAQPMVKSLFFEDVVAWLEESGVRYTERPKFAGISGYDHLFDFVIPKSKTEPERILKAITTPKRDTAESLIHAWTDTKGARAPDSRAYAFLNDAGQEVPGGVAEALRNYEIRPVVWSKRNQVRQELAA